MFGKYSSVVDVAEKETMSKCRRWSEDKKTIRRQGQEQRTSSRDEPDKSTSLYRRAASVVIAGC
jgi:hypothetical protein